MVCLLIETDQNVYIYDFWKPFDFCNVKFFWVTDYFFPVFEKNREAAYFFPPPRVGALGQNIYRYFWEKKFNLLRELLRGRFTDNSSFKCKGSQSAITSISIVNFERVIADWDTLLLLLQ